MTCLGIGISFTLAKVRAGFRGVHARPSQARAESPAVAERTPGRPHGLTGTDGGLSWPLPENLGRALPAPRAPGPAGVATCRCHGY